MSDLAIRVEGLGKRYKIARSEKRGRYKTLQEDILALPGRFWSAARGNGAGQEGFWALEDVSFEVKQGEVLGIIGRNGAGKSTLLKILANITEPTSGRAEIYGRVGSLLEVGTGFHPELTGRENVFLSGAILGMTHREVQLKFDEIVAFAGVEKYIDTPAKHYSSGMYMRLAFAVAAHLEPEILLVDEVLAVGDAEFQKKCLGKMGEVAQAGRTVLFVSHNMAAIQQLCTEGILLDVGKLQFLGPVHQAVQCYIAENTDGSPDLNLRTRRDRLGDGSLRFTRVGICDREGRPLARVLSGQDIKLIFEYEAVQAVDRARVEIAFNVTNSSGLLLTNLNSKDVGGMMAPVGHKGCFECVWPHFNLRSGTYRCALFCEINGTIADWIQAAFQINVDDGDYFGTGSLISRTQGDVLVDYEWSYQLGERV